MRGEKSRHFEAAAAGSADHHGFPAGIEFAEPICDLPHRYVHEVGWHRRQRRFPVFTNIHKGHCGAAVATLQKLARGHFLDHQNTNFGAAAALISGSMTVSNKLSRS